MKKGLCAALIGFSMVGSFVKTAEALPESRSGRILSIYADPSDIVMGLDVVGPCGSFYYHIQRNNLNWKELYSLMLLAFATGKSVSLVVANCTGDRNILSHG